MEISLSADLQAKLTRIALERGTGQQALAREAIERLVDYETGSYGKSRKVWRRSSAARP